MFRHICGPCIQSSQQLTSRCCLHDAYDGVMYCVVEDGSAVRSAATISRRRRRARGRPSQSLGRASSATAPGCSPTGTAGWCSRCSASRSSRASSLTSWLQRAGWVLCLPCFPNGTVLKAMSCCTLRFHDHGLVACMLLRGHGIAHELMRNLQPDGTGLSMARALDEMGVPVTMVLDAGVAYCMSR